MARSRSAGAPQARSDAYTALLALSLVAMVASCLLLFLDYNTYPTVKPPKVDMKVFSDPTPGTPAADPAAAPAAPAAPPAN
jgi:hypothetical protein